MAYVATESPRTAKKVADYAAGVAEQLVPVDTGYLQSTIHAEQEGDDAVVMVDADYAGFVEFGTYKMAAQPYLYPAVMQSADQFGVEFEGMFSAF